MSTRVSHISDQPPTNGSAFADRLRWIVGKRPINTWAETLRIAGGTRARMLKDGGAAPTSGALTRISRTENASLSWLLDAQGAPFLVCRTIDDDDTARMLEAHSADSADWRISLLIGGALSAFVLRMPAVIAHQKGNVPYTMLEVIAGPAGKQAMAAVAGFHRTEHVHDVGAAAMRAIHHGWIGTWRLLGDKGLLQTAHKLGNLNAWARKGTLRVADDDGPGYESTPAGKLLRIWPALPEPQRQALQVAIDNAAVLSGGQPAAGGQHRPGKPDRQDPGSQGAG